MTSINDVADDREEQREMNGNAFRTGAGSVVDAAVLSVPVPPMLERAIGYDGQSHLAAFSWGSGDEVCHTDGRCAAYGEWDAFLLLIQHPTVAPALLAYDFGSSESEAVHWLLLDRDRRQLSVAPVAAAQQLLKGQWNLSQPEPVPIIDEAAWAHLAAEIEAAIAQMMPPQIMTAIAAHLRLLQELSEWLDRPGKEGAEQ